MKITGAQVFGEDLKFEKRDIFIENGLIVNEASGSGEEVDASDCYAIPGLVDIHFHGALGYDFCDGTKEAYEKVGEYEAKRGVTAICPATLTIATEDLKNVLSLGAEYAAKEHTTSADLVGFNMEGPFISRAKKGAQNEQYIRNVSAELVDEFLEASQGLLKIIGLAPEENPGFEEYIAAVKDKVKVSLAHTGADYDAAKRAIDAGACHAVHLYNAMTGFTHRDPGVVGAVFDSGNVTAEIICDGIHIHPAAVRTAFKMVGKDKMILISDSVRCTGMPDGAYTLGGQDIIKAGRRCTLAKEGNIAGSASDLMDCLVHAVKHMDIPLEDAVAAATINPARCIGADHSYGAIRVGRAADIVLLRKEDLSLKAVFKRGNKLM